MKNVHTEHIKGQNSYFLVVPFPMPRSIKWENTYFMKTLKRYIYIFEQSLKIRGRSQENMLLVHCFSVNIRDAPIDRPVIGISRFFCMIGPDRWPAG